MVDNPKTARFYLLPKVNKINNPGRPIINAINSPTSSIAEFVDYQLQPKIPQGALLMTMDVTSLYTNMAHNEGINAATLVFEENDSISTSTRVTTKHFRYKTTDSYYNHIP